jgi:hypothetical protein
MVNLQKILLVIEKKNEMQNFVDFEEDAVFGKMSPSKFFVFFDHQNAFATTKS